LEKINNVTKSGIFLQDKKFSDYLGEITYDEEGSIIGAKATVIRWFGRLNASESLLHPVTNRDEPIDQRTLDFEGEMIKILLNTTQYPEGLESFPNVQRSFGDVAISTIVGDISYLAIGFAIVLIYIIVMLGKFSWVENRIYLSVAGLVSVVMGIIVAYGFCSAVGLFFGPMHNVLPFLLLGIGIDDMFVIVQSWETLTEKEQKEKSLVERFGIVMTHSGVAITITSITDFVAFALGGTTILPALRSFCFFASVGIISIYWFVCTFFVAFMYLDQIRLESNRDGLWPCYKHKNYKGNFFTEKGLSRFVFDIYGKLLMKTPAKIAVVIVTVAVTGVGIWGNYSLEQKFVPAWFLPPDSYLSKWFVANERYFPFGGDRVTVWCSGLDYVNELEQINNLVLTLANQTDIIDNVDSWTTKYLEYIQLPSYSLSSWDGDFKQFGNDSYFYHKLTQFIFSPMGAKYRGQFKFEFEPWCGYAAPNVFMTDITFTHKVFSGPSEHIPAMNRVKKIISEANLTGNVFPLSQGYAAWETDEVISYELYRNLGLAILCIFVTTIILVGHLICALLVLFMVVLSLIDVAGFMHFWGLTIDTVSCVNLIIAIGLCVDYSAHIAHRFLVERNGTRQDRVRMTLLNIGPAVMNGGVSTFIAFVLLANSKSHVFITFFKIFLLVVIFGLFHGLAVLPVILSWIGPEPNVELKTDSGQTSIDESEESKEADFKKSNSAFSSVTFVSEEVTPKSA
jgi:predicted RND superfamily exporter protein